MVGVSHEDVGVDEAGEAAADEGADPVDPVAGEVTGDDGGAEGSGRVHGAAGEGAGGEDVGADDEADGDGGYDAEGALLGVGGGGKDGVDEGEGDDDLHHHSLHGSHSGGQAVDWGGLIKPKQRKRLRVIWIAIRILKRKIEL